MRTFRTKELLRFVCSIEAKLTSKFLPDSGQKAFSSVPVLAMRSVRSSLILGVPFFWPRTHSWYAVSSSLMTEPE